MTVEQSVRELIRNQDKSNEITSAAEIIRKEIKELKDEMPWPPQPIDLDPDKFTIPSKLNAFLTFLLGGKEDVELSGRNIRLRHSLHSYRWQS